MPSRLWWRVIPACVVALLLAGCAMDGPMSAMVPAGPIAQDQWDLFMWTYWLSWPVIILVAGVLIYVIARFRRRGNDNSVPVQVHGNPMLEVAWTIVPVIIVVLVAVPAVRSIFRTQAFVEAGPSDVLIQVTGYQWWWKFEYPQHGFTTANEIHVPVGARVVVHVSSADVLHAFWVPKMGAKIDLIPNQDNQVWFQADEEGVFYGQCAELCLGAHAYMKLRVVVTSQAEYDAWVASFQQPAVQTVSADPLVTQGRQLLATKGCIGCHSVGNYAEGMRLGQPGFPDLTIFGLRTSVGAGLVDATLDNVTAWIADPQSLKPGNRMPTLWTENDPNREQEARAIAAYLLSLGVTPADQATVGAAAGGN